MTQDLDYLDHLARESSRFVEVLAEARPDSPVPSCPDWTAEDLLWHLAEVQWFWGTIVRERVVDATVADNLSATRPGTRQELETFYAQVSRGLSDVLAASAPETTVWTWSEDHSVGFIRRRQAHEALIHRVDAELTAGRRTQMDPTLSADGVDEVLRVMYGGQPSWGRFTPDSGLTVRINATDTGDTWLVVLGRFSGTDPEIGKSYDEPDLRVADTDPDQSASAWVSGRAADLDCWLWHRAPMSPVTRRGDEGTLARFDAVIAPGIN